MCRSINKGIKFQVNGTREFLFPFKNGCPTWYLDWAVPTQQPSPWGKKCVCDPFPTHYELDLQKVKVPSLDVVIYYTVITTSAAAIGFYGNWMVWCKYTLCIGCLLRILTINFFNSSRQIGRSSKPQQSNFPNIKLIPNILRKR